MKTVAGTAAVGSIGTLATGTAVAVESTPIAVNCGGNSYTADSGITYDADRNYSGGKTYTASDSIGNTTDDPLYQSERYDGQGYSYSFDVQNGTYDVTLKFAEVYHTNDGERVFDVEIEGTEVVTNLDLHATVGHDVAYDETHTVDVTDGTLDLNFPPASAGAPKIGAILVEEAGTGGQSPYGGSAASIPGRVQAEEYDEGGQDVAYHDTTSENQGGDFRTDEAVDVETSGSDLGGYNVGWIEPGEWLEFTCNVDAGTYDVAAEVASPNGSGAFELSQDGTTVGSTSVPSTGAWQEYTTVTISDVDLSGGTSVIRVDVTGSGFNLHSLDFREPTETVSYDAALLTDDIDLSWYQHSYHAEYASADDSTFVIYQSTDTGGSNTSAEDSDGDAYALAYDHSTGTVDGPYRVGYNPLYAGDTHGVPSMVIDGDGYIHTFFGDHSRHHFQYARTENPYDVSSWIHPPSGASGSDYLTQLPQGTYPCMTYNPDEDAVYVLYRSDNHNIGTLGRSVDGGVTWTDVNNGVMDFSGGPGSHNDAYVSALGAWQGRIHMTWTIAEDHGGGHNDARRNIYHGAYNPSTGNVENTDGTDLGSTITWSDATNYCMVKDTGDANIGGDSNGNSVKTFHHAYDPGSDTAYIGASYALDDNTSQLSAFTYHGISDGSGSWQETKLTTESPPRQNCSTTVTENGRAEITMESENSNTGELGLWVEQSDGTWEFEAISFPVNLDFVQRGVHDGRDDFSWYGLQKHSRGDNLYALGQGQPSGAGADYTKPPKNLRVTSEGSGTATIDWDHGRAGPSGVDSYNVYVDGTLHKSVTTTPPGQPTPRTWTGLSLSGGSHTVEVTLVNGDSAESARSNAVTVSV